MTSRDDASQTADPAHDLRWTRDVRDALRCAGVLLALLLVLDWSTDRLTLRRGALWIALALLLFEMSEQEDIVFVEVTMTHPSEFEANLAVHGEVLHNRYRVLAVESSSVPNALLRVARGRPVRQLPALLPLRSG